MQFLKPWKSEEIYINFLPFKYYRREYISISIISLFRILNQHSKNGIAWCEAFLMSILQVKALDIISISPQEVKKYNLIFPNPSFLSKIPVYLTPEELAPPLQWMQMTTLTVCVLSKKPKSPIEANRDVIGDFKYSFINFTFKSSEIIDCKINLMIDDSF